MSPGDRASYGNVSGEIVWVGTTYQTNTIQDTTLGVIRLQLRKDSSPHAAREKLADLQWAAMVTDDGHLMVHKADSFKLE